MMNLILAQQGSVDDWIQYIVVIVVVGLSVLGQVSKALIKKFSPEEREQRRQDEVTPTMSAPPPLRDAAPRSPVAPPARRRTSRTPAAARPRPMRPITPRPQAPPIARPRPAAPRQLSTSPPPPAAQPRPVLQEADPLLQRRHLAQIASVIEKEGEIVEEAVREHIGHVESDLPEIVEATVVESHGPFARPSRAMLRRAIVFNEVLAPPLALRPASDRW